MERARREFGDVNQRRRAIAAIDRRRSQAQREDLLMSMLDDLRYAARSLARRPALLVVCGVTLSIGIAANAVMFGVVDQLLLRPPAHIAAPGAVKHLYFRDVRREAGNLGKVNAGEVTAYPVLTALRANATGFSDLAAIGWPSSYSLGRGVDAISVKAQLVSGNFFRLLGARPVLGRFFTDQDDRVPAGEPVAVLSHGLWLRHFGGSNGVIGRVVPIQGRNYEVVGVAPRGFTGIDRDQVDLWLPVSAEANEALGPGWHNTANHWWARIIGRVRDGVAPAIAQEQATAAYRGLLREWKDRWRDSTGSVVLSTIVGARTPDGVSRESRVSLWLLGVSAIVLLIACANVANLLIARTLERRRELSVRLALGVSHGRLVRMLLAEAALLAAIGSAAALAIGYGASRLVQNVLLPDIVWSESVLDARVFGFTLGVTLLCILLAGLAPALQGLSTKVLDGLKGSSRQVAGGRGRLRFALLLAQAALSVVLLVGAGLFVYSLRNVVSHDVGIDRDRVLRVTMPLSRFGFDRPFIEDIYRRGAERLRTMPGVSGVAVARLTVPMGSASASNFEVPGVERPTLRLGGPYNAAVTSGFFATVGASLVRGRDFTPAEERGARVLIVNQTLAQAYWPNANPVGQCARFGGDTACSEIVGVVHDVMQFGLVHDERAIVYAPAGHPGVGGALPGAMLVRVTGDPANVIPLVWRELQALAPTMPFVTVRTYADLVAPQLQPWRLGATMFALFGAIALLIAGIGLYSVLSYWVSQRTPEIGIRMALGARRADVVHMVLLQSSRAVGAGVLLGGAIALFASRWANEMLYETSPYQPSVYITAAVVLALAGAAASIVPARRCTAVDPAMAIRTE